GLEPGAGRSPRGCLPGSGIGRGLLSTGWQGDEFPTSPRRSQCTNAPHPMPTMEQMKALADAKAAPLLEKLKTTPNDAGLLAQVGSIFSSMHQFKEAARYYDKSLKLDPKNVPIRTELASSLYYSGDVDGALAQLE